jgi:aldehyde:ferredoxin oxidoreductase
VNLTNGKIREESLKEDVYWTFLGGYGLGIRIVYSDIEPKTDPLGPGNILGLTTGILTGTLTPFTGSHTVVGKSPLTGTWGDSRSGGHFGPVLKFAGYDAVFFYGKSKKPVYFVINDGKVEIKDATKLWGKDTSETEDMIKEECKDDRVKVACIGPSGEKLSRISGIITDKGRAAARSGLGAVMGSKNLKAVAVRGTGKVPVYDSEEVIRLRKKFIDEVKDTDYWKDFSKYGTADLMDRAAFNGDAPVKNWAGSGKEDFPTAPKTYGDIILKYFERKYACYGCPLGCGGFVKVEKGPYAVKGHKPEYETIAAFGSLCLNDDVESIIFVNDICNRYGLDTISAGNTIAFAIECYENNVISKRDTDGIELTWGNSEAIVRMTEKIAKRDGFGDVLADGVRIAAEKIGRGAEKYAMHVCGEEVPMHDPRFLPGLGLTYVSDATPARHTQGTMGYAERDGGGRLTGLAHLINEKYSPHGKAPIHAIEAKFSQVFNALGTCWFWTFFTKNKDVPDHVDFLKAVTGWDTNWSELLECGERIQCLRQAFNVKEGFKPKDFKLPKRILGKPPLKSGPLKDVSIDVDTRLKEYFEYMDWDLETGKPSKKKLLELGLEDVAKDLWC